ncbi:MAG: cob(I)yrinic acid a,c-diamide adenosyltransferase [Deltaproteobacteria bacterium]|nr:cob(I)yrinic acid a,c-diamide adenosyltransferase [Deltaproteobacteria bacterium]
MRGYVQVYTGNGKGKTTAALGLALRAAGAGLRVYIAQFAKSGEYSEINALKKYRGSITVRQYGRIWFINGDPDDDDIQAARKGLEKVKEAMCSGKYDVVILDEANIATRYRLLSVDELLAFIEAKPEHIELVITGRDADARIIERADLVTEMREIKHYFQRGIQARIGIEK